VSSGRVPELGVLLVGVTIWSVEGVEPTLENGVRSVGLTLVVFALLSLL
jgi:hypothetical protein